jgi:hypothetical protein
MACSFAIWKMKTGNTGTRQKNLLACGGFFGRVNDLVAKLGLSINLNLTAEHL